MGAGSETQYCPRCEKEQPVVNTVAWQSDVCEECGTSIEATEGLERDNIRAYVISGVRHHRTAWSRKISLPCVRTSERAKVWYGFVCVRLPVLALHFLTRGPTPRHKGEAGFPHTR